MKILTKSHVNTKRVLTGTASKSDDSAFKASILFLKEILDGYHPRNFAVRFWNGEVWDAEDGQKTHFTIVLKHPGSLRKMFWPPGEMSLCEAYICEDFDLEGDMEKVFRLGEYFMSIDMDMIKRLRYGRMLFSLPSCKNADYTKPAPQLNGSLHSMDRDRQAVTYHYNISSDFYALWLDKNMIYSCGYFESPEDCLEKAQERKLDYICRKLRLKRGERFLDVGCGWGGLVIHAAKNYSVDALGVTLSGPQAGMANERIKKSGLKNCRVDVIDYRKLGSLGLFDKAASVGMVEHVGGSMMTEYFRHIYKLLHPGGVFLNHGITRPVDILAKSPFSQKYVFPDGELVSISAMLKKAEEAGFEVRDVESLREHYALTLNKWLRRLEAHYEKARALISEKIYRIWRLYMASSGDGFRKGIYNIHQSLLLKPDSEKYLSPTTRNEWYK